MLFRVCITAEIKELEDRESFFKEVDALDRYELTRYIEAHRENLQPFNVPEAGNVAVWAVELHNGKPTDALYFHKVAQFIWLELE